MGDTDNGLDVGHLVCPPGLVWGRDANLGINPGLPGDGLGSFVLLLRAGQDLFAWDIAARFLSAESFTVSGRS